MSFLLTVLAQAIGAGDALEWLLSLPSQLASAALPDNPILLVLLYMLLALLIRPVPPRDAVERNRRPARPRRGIRARNEDERIYQQWKQTCTAAFDDSAQEIPRPPFWPDVARLLGSGDNATQRQKDEKRRWHPDRLHFTQRPGGTPAWVKELFVAIQDARV